MRLPAPGAGRACEVVAGTSAEVSAIERQGGGPDVCAETVGPVGEGRGRAAPFADSIQKESPTATLLYSSYVTVSQSVSLPSWSFSSHFPGVL